MTQSEEKHLSKRIITTIVIIVVFIIYTMIYTDNYSNSCLGNPSLLVFAFIGFPIIILLAIFDIIYILIVKSFTKRKLVINFLIVFTIFIFLIMQGIGN